MILKKAVLINMSDWSEFECYERETEEQGDGKWCQKWVMMARIIVCLYLDRNCLVKKEK